MEVRWVWAPPIKPQRGEILAKQQETQSEETRWRSGLLACHALVEFKALCCRHKAHGHNDIEEPTAGALWLPERNRWVLCQTAAPSHCRGRHDGPRRSEEEMPDLELLALPRRAAGTTPKMVDMTERWGPSGLPPRSTPSLAGWASNSREDPACHDVLHPAVDNPLASQVAPNLRNGDVQAQDDQGIARAELLSNSMYSWMSPARRRPQKRLSTKTWVSLMVAGMALEQAAPGL